ncbi:MAG TPA: hypothetical protein VIF09_21895 [Polyangiaceae bacterium]
MAPAPPVAPAIAWLGTWAKPPDRPAQVALGAGLALLVVALAPGGPRWLASMVDFASLVDLARRRRFLTVAGFVASFLSLGYLAFYLRGGPRAPEAATYWLQGRAMSHGWLAWSVIEPSASFRAKDLLFDAPDGVSGIFPPGYPLLLAPAFLVGAPMLIGPLLAAALVVATWLLARETAFMAGEREARAEAIARIAAGLSVLCAALRYHTADALPHGAVAVTVAMALATAMSARRTGETRLFGVTGLAVGFLVATQPVSAVTTGAVVLALAVGDARRWRALAWMLVPALPGLLLLAAANHAAVGHVFASPVATYRALFDSRPPMPLRAITITTLHRLRAHLLDVANFEPLALLALVGVRRGGRGARLGALIVAGQILLAAPFDAQMVAVGAGAKLLAPVIPLEHVLIAMALWRLAPAQLGRAAIVTFGLSLAGFAVHAASDHEKLAASDLGRPRYEPDVAREANVTHGLLFFEDDQGFELAFDPGVNASHGIQAARLRNDDHDRLLYDSLGHPAIHRYSTTSASAAVTYWTPPGAGREDWRFESESDWPPAAVWNGHADAIEATASCVSEGRAIELVPASTGEEASVTIALPVPHGPTPSDRKAWQAIPRIFLQGTGASATLEVVARPGGKPLTQWTWKDDAKTPQCEELPAQSVEIGGDIPRAWLVLRTKGGAVALDKTTLRTR